MDEGLTKAEGLLLHRGELTLVGGYADAPGWYAHGEVAYKLTPSLGVYGFAEKSQASGFASGVGGRLTF